MRIEPSPPGWLDAVLADFDTFLRDHASAEKKASGMALNVASHYPDRPALLTAMVDLAVEELSHYREVVRLLVARGLQPGPDSRDPYVRALNGEVRRGADAYLLDRLLIGAVVERRGAERFALVRDALGGPESAGLRRFYAAISASEARHWQLFVTLARRFGGVDERAVDARLAELLDFEAGLVRRLPPRAALH